MLKILNHKLFEIFFEKLLIAALLFFAGVIANQSLERYKLIEVKRVGDTDAFVSACQAIWSKVYEYETTLSDLHSSQTSRKFLKIIGGKDLKAKNAEINEKLKLIEIQLVDLKKITDEQKFVIGQNFVIHFWQYIGLIKASAEAKSDALEKTGNEAKTAQEVSDSLYKQAVLMRFTADMAREYAVSKLPK